MALLEAIWFLLPAGFANMAPIFAAKLLPRLDYPVDCGRTFHGKRIFGDHKTFRGLVSGVAVATVVFEAQRRAWASRAWARNLSRFDYGRRSPGFGALLGVGALGGDLLKSFFKRRIGREPGAPWFPFDQLDWIVGTLAVAAPVVRLPRKLTLLTTAEALALSLLMKRIGYDLHLNKTPY